MGEKNYELSFFISVNDLDFFTRKVRPKLEGMPQGVNMEILQEGTNPIAHVEDDPSPMHE